MGMTNYHIGLRGTTSEHTGHRTTWDYIGRLLDNSQIRQLADCQLADWTSRGLDISRTGQLADATGDFVCLVFVILVASARP